MNRLTLWFRFRNFILSIFNFRNTEQPQEALPSPRGVKIKSLYERCEFKPSDVTKEIPYVPPPAYEKTWYGKRCSLDLNKTIYKFEQPTFMQRMRNSFGSVAGG
jgi:hypothetical protein